MTAISKNVYINKLDDIVDEYNNTYHRSIKMKSIDVKDFIRKNSKRLIKKNSEQRKYLRKKVISYMRNGKVIIIYLIVGLIKKI